MAIYRGDGGAGVANPTYETAVIADQTGNSGKYLTTDGTNTSWAAVSGTGTVTSVAMSGGSTGLTTTGGPVTTSGTFTLGGTLASTSGGTGLTSYTTGDIIYASATDTLSKLAAGTNGYVLTLSGGVPTWAASGAGSMVYPGAGIAVSTGSAWGTSITDNSTNWNTAYTDRLKWDGGSTGLTASTGRTSLGVTATGADTTYAYRANNLSDLASASTARTNLGLGTAATMTGPSGTIVGTTDTQTLTNKRITPRVSTTTSSATPTINTDNVDMYGLTAQAADITSFTTNLSGTPTDGQKLWIYIVGTAARAITWGASFESSTTTLPTTTVSTNRLDVGFVWNAATSKWRCVASA